MDALPRDAALHRHLVRAMEGENVNTVVEAGDRAFELYLQRLPDGGVTGAAIDVSDRVRAEARLVEQSYVDTLTGLPNRNLLVDRIRMSQARARRGGPRPALYFIGVDRLRRVNESLGHAAGDSVLVALAARLRAHVRPTDTVARFAGDRFVVLCEGVDTVPEALAIAERLQGAAGHPVSLGGRQIVLEASLGIVLLDSERDSAAAIGDAEIAMYRAKDVGGARSVVFEEAMRTGALARLDTEHSLRLALERGEFCMHYQPIIDLRSGQISNMEALLRWEHPERGLVPPSEFIPLAEETGLIVPIGRWVIEEVLQQLHQWTAEGVVGESVGVSLNVSAVQLGQPGLPRIVEQQLVTNDISPSRVCIEITESWLMSDADAAGAVLERLSALGVGLAVDDFGTGYSSLAYLGALPIDALKVDQAFVRDLDAEPPRDAIPGAVVDLAHRLGLTAVGEGAETAAHVDQLRRLGCDRAQGYFFGRPMPPDRVAVFLAGQPAW